MTTDGSVELYAVISNAAVEPLPPRVPAGTRVRAVVTREALTLLWMRPTGEVDRVDLPMSAEDTAAATYEGGTVGPYRVVRAPGCSGCGAATLLRFVPFSDIRYVQRVAPGATPYGVPPTRDETPHSYR